MTLMLSAIRQNLQVVSPQRATTKVACFWPIQDTEVLKGHKKNRAKVNISNERGEEETKIAMEICQEAERGLLRCLCLPRCNKTETGEADGSFFTSCQGQYCCIALALSNVLSVLVMGCLVRTADQASYYLCTSGSLCCIKLHRSEEARLSFLTATMLHRFRHSVLFPAFTWAAAALSAAAGAAAVLLPALHPGLIDSKLSRLHIAKEEERWSRIFFFVGSGSKGLRYVMILGFFWWGGRRRKEGC
ncbi:uncharacterized protein LOC120324336 [Pipra filicauda]|uniref:Uncharacterized protein LOC120324336 n=1 Tax=Pipra filicauda TaxID=649802 RepID=A0A7R5L0Z3_9PASS|nr:uncharacterized protein LOC120324336 [Pipra filicauda]